MLLANYIRNIPKATGGSSKLDRVDWDGCTLKIFLLLIQAQLKLPSVVSFFLPKFILANRQLTRHFIQLFLTASPLERK